MSLRRDAPAARRGRVRRPQAAGPARPPLRNRGHHPGARPRRAPRRVAAGRGRGRVDHPRVDQGGHPPLLRPRARSSSSRPAPVEFHDKIPLKTGLRAGRARRASGDGAATAAFLEPGVRAHARIRQHRRARGRGHHGRHLGHRRLVRADRAATATWPGASASAACSSRRPRSRSSSRTACFVGSRAVVVEGVRVEREAVIGAGVVLTSSTAILDVSGPQVVELPRARARRAASSSRACARRSSRPGSSRCPAPSSSASAPSPPTRRSASTRRCATSRCPCERPEGDLDETLLWLCSIASPIGEERALCDAVQERLGKLRLAAPVRRYGDSIVVPLTRGTGAEDRPGRPPRHGPHRERPRAHRGGPLLRRRLQRHEERPRADDRAGRGRAPTPAAISPWSSTRARRAPSPRTSWARCSTQDPELPHVDLAVCLEPSDNKLHLGCMGSVHATVTFVGRTAHSARPWEGTTRSRRPPLC